MSYWDQSSGDARSFDGAWEKLSRVAVEGAEYDSPERQPHPKCLPRTRVTLLNHAYGLLDIPEKSRLVWLYGTAGVGKSAVAFTVAERMRGLCMKTSTTGEKRLAGTFFFSRKYTERCTTGHLFATLAYQLASNFPSIRDDLSAAIRENPAVLDPKKPLRNQMETLFLRPLRNLRFRLRECPPLVFVIDALDECTSEADIALLISLLGEVLCEPDLPVTHILLTSRSETHIREAIYEEQVRLPVHEIPVKTSGEGITSLISLDGADVDSDICIFLEHSFTKLRSRYPTFPQPTENDLVRLASRAGRRFIVASTMMKFIDDGYSDPRDRLQLMLELTSRLLPGTEVYKLYDLILSTCTDPKRAYLHLSIVAALADPLPISQISELLGPGQGRDVETVLVQLRSVINIPTESSLPVNIYHSSVRDYVLEPSNCSLFEEQYMTTPPHALLAYSSFRLMIHDIPESTGLLDLVLKLKTQSRAMESQRPQSLMDSLAFIVEPPTALGVLIALLWLHGDRSPPLYPWLETSYGRAWLRTQSGKIWLDTQFILSWLNNSDDHHWLQTLGGKKWLQTPDEQHWVQSSDGQYRLQALSGRRWLKTQSLLALASEKQMHMLQTPSKRRWLPISGHGWLQTPSEREWLQTPNGREWLRAPSGREWVQTPSGQQWLQTASGRLWVHTPSGREWLWTVNGREWLQTPSGRHWLQTLGGQEWLQTRSGREWLPTPSGREWLQTPVGQEWLQIEAGKEWLQTENAQEWLQTENAQEWLQTENAREWLQTQSGREWLKTPQGQAWQSTPAASFWVPMEEFFNIVEEIGEFIIIPELSLLSAFHMIQQLKTLPDFLMFPAFLALNPNCPSSALAHGPDMEVIHVMNAFVSFTHEARKRSRSSSDALMYACQNWAMHLSRAPNPRDKTLDQMFKFFLEHHLLSWFERQWCLGGLRSCLVVLSEGQKLAKLSRSLI